MGGDKPAYERVEPILRELGTPAHVDDNGQGIALKLAINISLAVQLPTVKAADEVLERARELGYDHRDLAALYELLERLADRSSASIPS